jgi:hypothetical protein
VLFLDAVLLIVGLPKLRERNVEVLSVTIRHRNLATNISSDSPETWDLMEDIPPRRI